MRSLKHSVAVSMIFAIFPLILAMTATRAFAQQEKVLHSFNPRNLDGYSLFGGLIFDKSGNLFGTTYQGGAHSDGTVFELTPKAGGGWTEKILYSFSGSDGYNPSAGVISDSAGNLYGTTESGGSSGGGTVFELIPGAGGIWTETVLHSFKEDGVDGSYLTSGVAFDAHGNLYGTTYEGGAYAGGIVFELTPAAGGTWTETVLHNFSNNGTDGYNPVAAIAVDASGNLYGDTGRGGAGGGGTVFELAPMAGGGWREKILHNFGTGTDGSTPVSTLIFDSIGNLYGVTGAGGANGLGTVFELTLKTGGSWMEKALHSFDNNGVDGYEPLSALAFDSAGNLYGTTAQGGANGYGTVFELRPKPSGGWTEKVLHNFNDNGKDGFQPQDGALIFDSSGNLYGTTLGGGADNEGTVFEITP